MPDQLLWVDWLILAVVGVSVAVSLWRGLMREVLSLTAWVAAFAVAIVFADAVAQWLAALVDVPSVRRILAFGGLFLLTLFVGGLVNLLVARLLETTGLTGTDRLLGAAFGVARGMAVVTVLVLVVGFVPALHEDPWWSQSLLLPYFRDLAAWLGGLMPDGFAASLALR